jgi:hypothetical protein
MAISARPYHQVLAPHVHHGDRHGGQSRRHGEIHQNVEAQLEIESKTSKRFTIF